MERRVFRYLRILALFLAGFAACGSTDAAPLKVPLIKLQYPGHPKNIDMVYIRLLGVGTRRINQPVLLDTGSSGLVVQCEAVLPASLCSTTGIRLREQSRVDGILVTMQTVVAHYEAYDEYGNLAYALVRFGSSRDPVTTARPIWFVIRYKKVRRATGEIVGGPLWPKGIFGISPIGDIGAMGQVRSPLAAVNMPAGLFKGYVLGPLGPHWSICTIEAGNCPEVDALTLGIDPDRLKDFHLNAIRRALPRQSFPSIATCIHTPGHDTCAPTLFDTGSSDIELGIGPGEKAGALGADVPVSVTSPEFGAWHFKTTYSPEVTFRRLPDRVLNVVGIRYFEENSLAVDLDERLIGFHLGSD